MFSKQTYIDRRARLAKEVGKYRHDERRKYNLV